MKSSPDTAVVKETSRMFPFGHTPHETLARDFLVPIVGFGLLSLLAGAAARFEYMAPNSRLFEPAFFGQLMGLHKVLLEHFFLLPAVPVVFGLARLPGLVGSETLAFPRLARWTLYLFVLSGVLVLASFGQGRIEPGWAYAVGSPSSVEWVSGVFLVGLALLYMSLALVAVNLIATMRMGGDVSTQSLLVWSLHLVSWILVVAVPIRLAAITLAFFPVLIPNFSWVDAPALVPMLYAFSITPLQVSVWIGAGGIVATILRAEEILTPRHLMHMRGVMVVLAVMGFVAIEYRAMSITLPAGLELFVSYFKCLLMVPLYWIAIPLLCCAAVCRKGWDAARTYALGILLVIVFVAPLDAYLSLPGVTGMYLASYLAPAKHYFLVGAVGLFALLGGLHYWWEDLTGRRLVRTASLNISFVVVFGIVATLVPLVMLGWAGVPAALAVYPESFTLLQVAASAGGTILGLGLLGVFCLLTFSRFSRVVA